MFELVLVKASVSNFHLFLMEQLKGGIEALKCSPKEQTEYLILFQALKVPANQWKEATHDSFILIRKRREKSSQHMFSREVRQRKHWQQCYSKLWLGP